MRPPFGLPWNCSYFFFFVADFFFAAFLVAIVFYSPFDLLNRVRNDILLQLMNV